MIKYHHSIAIALIASAPLWAGDCCRSSPNSLIRVTREVEETVQVPHEELKQGMRKVKKTFFRDVEVPDTLMVPREIRIREIKPEVHTVYQEREEEHTVYVTRTKEVTKQKTVWRRFPVTEADNRHLGLPTDATNSSRSFDKQKLRMFRCTVCLPVVETYNESITEKVPEQRTRTIRFPVKITSMVPYDYLHTEKYPVPGTRISRVPHEIEGSEPYKQLHTTFTTEQRRVKKTFWVRVENVGRPKCERTCP